MSQGLLAARDSVHIRLGPNKEIKSADGPVFEPQHQEEARMIIYETDYLKDYLDEFSSLLLMGRSQFVTITEPGRQTAFRYDQKNEQLILLTRAHLSIQQVLEDLN